LVVAFAADRRRFEHLTDGYWNAYGYAVVAAAVVAALGRPLRRPDNRARCPTIASAARFWLGSWVKAYGKAMATILVPIIERVPAPESSDRSFGLMFTAVSSRCERRPARWRCAPPAPSR
jgi:hypothetical protein